MKSLSLLSGYIFLIIATLVNSEATKQFDQSSIQYFQSISGNQSLDITMWAFSAI